jgi:hypothetical protein
MNPLRLILLSAVLVTTIHAAEESGTAPDPRVPDRYLLLVDVSGPMKPRIDGVKESVTSLLVSGMKGQIQPGDELGVWTFNNQLYTGDFELVRWDDAARNDIVRSVLTFIEDQRFKADTDFSAVMPHLMDVVSQSRRITIILYGDGDEVIAGTPFDRPIREFYRKHAETLKDKSVPMVTVLRGYKGRVIGHSIGFPPWPVEFPQFPPEPKPKTEPEETEAKSPQSNVSPNADLARLSRTLAVTNPGPIVFAEPLIVSGRTNPPTNAARNAVPPTREDRLVSSPSSNEIPEAPVDKSQSNAVADVPKAAPPSSPPLRLGLLIGIPVLVGGAILFLLLRLRPRSQSSLITRSMGRGKDSK